MPLEQKNELTPTGPLAVVVIGNDTLIEALPALPLQLAHACLAAGYDQVLPLSWGDELVAEAALRALQERPGEPAVLCACPLVRQRLLGAGSELTPMLILPPAPPVALARYVRARYGDHLGRLTYVGSCPAARSGGYDVTYSPQIFLGILKQQGIDLLGQPSVFDSVFPPDRRRFASLPGGCPSPEALWQRGGQRTLVTLSAGDIPSELAQRLLERETVLMDLAPAMGCACSGVTHVATHATTERSARIAVTSLEPPRSQSPIIEEDAPGSAPPPDDDSGSGRPLPAPHSGAGGAADGERQLAPESGPTAAPPSETRPAPDTARGSTCLKRAPMAITPPHALRAVVTATGPVQPPPRPIARRPSVPVVGNILR